MWSDPTPGHPFFLSHLATTSVQTTGHPSQEASRSQGSSVARWKKVKRQAYIQVPMF